MRKAASTGRPPSPANPDDSGLTVLVRTIAAGDRRKVMRRLAAAPNLARQASASGATRQGATDYFLDEIGRYLYAGDTALHIAAAAYRRDIAAELVARGADPRAKNRRGAEPLHSASVGMPGARNWNPDAQAEIIEYLIEIGADPNATDMSGVAALHRAVRTRCAEAVKALLAGGADPLRANRNGSTPMQLALQTTGRGGTGSPEAREQQRQIILLLRQHGARPADG
jgi:ankyrin repeat protein